uniref:Uncharacterized protein n=1 Tax=uncultured gamma proteobacterium HF0010_05D02 TaxID=710978 RepID=E0XQM3_9GAMM|nr:hypothetical protein [uncultured gamma proteobacterium HF0010_05D02]
MLCKQHKSHLNRVGKLKLKLSQVINPATHNDLSHHPVSSYVCQAHQTTWIIWSSRTSN